jgi:siroheme decarboxylase
MAVSDQDRDLLQALSAGLPLEPRPYARLGESLGITEEQVIARLRRMIATGIITRFGVIVRHRQLGYRANAMAVWDVPDALVSDAGRQLAALPYVTLCYRRPRVLPDWPYNLFCMIHGRSRPAVEAQLREASAIAGTANVPQCILFSKTCFKQGGARFKRAVSLPKIPVREAADGLA